MREVTGCRYGPQRPSVALSAAMGAGRAVYEATGLCFACVYFALFVRCGSCTWICRGCAATVQGESLASGGLVCISLGSLWIVYVDVLRVCRVQRLCREGESVASGGLAASLP